MKCVTLHYLLYSVIDYCQKKKEKKKEIANQELLQRAPVLQNLNDHIQQEENARVSARNKDEGYDSYEDLSEAPW